jgi:PKD repeat protein
MGCSGTNSIFERFMKNVPFLTILILFADIVSAQSWHRRYVSPYSYQTASDVVEDSNGNFIVAGNAQYPYRPLLFEITNGGNVLWSKQYADGNAPFSFKTILRELSGDFYILGRNNGIALMRLDSIGNVYWAKKYFLTAATQPASIIHTSDGNLLITGHDALQMILMKVDTAGNILWSKIHTGNYTTMFSGISNAIELSDNSIVYCETAGDTTAWWLSETSLAVLTKTDAAGNIMWSKEIYFRMPQWVMGQPRYTIPHKLFLDSQGEFILTYHIGVYGSFGGGQQAIARLDMTGNLIWASEGFSSTPVGVVSENPTGTLNTFIYGGTTADVISPYYSRLLKTNLNLSVLSSTRYIADYTGSWVNTFENSAAKQLADNRFILVGKTYEREKISVTVTDAAGDESCTNNPSPYGYIQDTSMQSRPISLNVSSGVSSGIFLPVVSAVSLYECTCDSFPSANFFFTVSGNTISFYDSSTNVTSWHWNFGDGNGDTIANPVHTYIDSIYHTVTLTVSNQCGTDYYVHTIVPSDTLNDIKFIKPNNTVNIFPNPSLGYFYIQSEIRNGQIEIYNTLGEKIHQQILTPAHQQIQLNASPGIYFVRVTDVEKVFTQKLVIE